MSPGSRQILERLHRKRQGQGQRQESEAQGEGRPGAAAGRGSGGFVGAALRRVLQGGCGGAAEPARQATEQRMPAVPAPASGSGSNLTFKPQASHMGPACLAGAAACAVQTEIG